MVRLRSKVNGVVVNVDDDTAARLGSTFEPVSTEAKTSAKKSATSKK